MSNIYANNINPRSGDTVTFPQNIKVLGTATYEDVTNIDSVGIITAQSGIHVTGGSVGIGTDNPNNNLDIAVDSNNEGIRISSSTNVFGKIDFHANRSGADAALGILDFNWNGTQVARIIGGTGTDTTNKDDGALQFHTASAGTATEKLRITGDGKILTAGAATVPLTSAGGIDLCCGLYSIVIGGNSGGGSNQNQRTDAGNKEGRIVSAHKTNAEEPVSVATIFNLSTQNLLYLGGGSSLVNAATDIAFYTAANTTTTGGTERMRIDSSGRMSMNGAVVYSTGGTANINSTFNVDVTVKNDSGGGLGGCYKVLAGISHVNFSSYGAAYETWAAGRGTTINETIVQVNQTSTQGGSWSISKPTNTTLRVTHTGGTLSAQGNYFVIVYAAA